MMYQRAMTEPCLLREFEEQARRSPAKIESTPKKKTARIVVMITTITPVMTVSRRVGHMTFAVSLRTCWMNSSGDVFATMFFAPAY